MNNIAQFNIGLANSAAFAPGIAAMTTLNLDATFADIVRPLGLDQALSDLLTPTRNFVVQPEPASGLEVAPAPRLVSPAEVAAEEENRDFRSGFRLALVWMQTRGEASRRKILRLATSTPSKMAGLTAAVALVVVLSQSSDDLASIRGALAESVEIVLAPYAMYELARRQKR